MADLSLLEKSKAAYEQTQEQERLAKMYPELQRKQKEQERRQALEEDIDTLQSRLQSLIKNKYQPGLNNRNTSIDELIKMLQSLKDQNFELTCSEVVEVAQQLALAKAKLNNWSLDAHMLRSETQQVLMDNGIYPLGIFQADDRENAKLLTLLSEILPYFRIKYPPQEPTKYLQVGSNGESFWTY